MPERQVSIDGRVTYFRWDEPHAVYRIFNHDGRLIYIGASYDPEARIKVHRREQSWGHEIASHTEVWYPTRREALAAEHRAIAAENPDYNVVGTPLGRLVSVAHLSSDKAEAIRMARLERAQEIAASRAANARLALTGKDED
jgi:predicted GIY-YIG superfamily endonuclease